MSFDHQEKFIRNEFDKIKTRAPFWPEADGTNPAMMHRLHSWALTMASEISEFRQHLPAAQRLGFGGHDFHLVTAAKGENDAVTCWKVTVPSFQRKSTVAMAHGFNDCDQALRPD